MIIEDDGKGFDPFSVISNEKTSNGEYVGGNGIKNMHTRAEDIKAKLSIRSKINEGTTVQLVLHM